MADRDSNTGFGMRTMKNLAYIEKARKADEDVHVVTQLVNSLIGLVVFPQQRKGLIAIEDQKLKDLEASGWPKFTPIYCAKTKPCNTLKELMRHLRNAVTHGQLEFSSDSRLLQGVDITLWDKNQEGVEVWKAKIRADHLRDFCLKLAPLVKD
jgi:hypothetical protein